MIKLAKSSDWADGTGAELLKGIGIGDGDGDGDSDSDGAPEPAPAPKRPPAPRSGTQAWGRWSHEGECIELELALPEGTRAKELVCEVSRGGEMKVARSGEPLLTGRIALPVDRAELAWLVEEQDDGSKLLCIELPLLPIETRRSVARLAIDCIFDETLAVNGEACLEPGLSGVEGRR